MGLKCIDCGAPVVNRRLYCESCAKKHRAKTNKAYRQKHLAELKEYFTENYKMYRSHGVCSCCHSADALPDRPVCAACSKKLKEYRRKWRAKHKGVKKDGANL